MLGVTRKSGNLVLALGPLPSCPPNPTRAVVDFSDGGRELYVAGLLTPAADGGAELVVESAPARRPSRSVRLTPPTDVAFAICLVEVDGGGRQCYPILDIGVRGFRVETSTPLALGTVLADLLVLFRREVLRSGEGVVTSCSPALYPDGRLVYECGVRYRSASPRRIETAASDRVEIDDVARVRAILWALCDLEYEVTVSGPTGVVKGTDVAAAGDRSWPRARAALPGQRRRPPPDPVGRGDRRVLAVRQRLSFLRADHRSQRGRPQRSRRLPSCANGTDGTRSERRSPAAPAPSSATATH